MTSSIGNLLAGEPVGVSPTYLNASQVRRRYGGVSDMALWRWLHDEKLGFPQPLRINRRRFWKERDLIAWENTRRQPHPDMDCPVE
jgi:predicted DNA-binding transcriptional regulator AlpA